jgi:hypothetical protein
MRLSITSTPAATPQSRRLDPEKLEIAKTEFKRLESAGIICHSKSPWASPSHMVPKKDGSPTPSPGNPLRQPLCRKRSACSEVHPSNWPFAKQAFNTLLAMSQQVFVTPLSHKNSGKTFFPFSQHSASAEARLPAYGSF